MTIEFIISVKNMLGEKSSYHDDLFSLFGDPDNLNSGYIGSKLKKPIKWDWGQSGLKKIMKFIFYVSLNRKDDVYFEKWYKQEQRDNFRHSSELFSQILYVFRYKGKTITAFIATVKAIEKYEGRIWLEFIPQRYILLPPTFTNEFKKRYFSSGREDPDKWSSELGIDNLITEKIFSSAASQDQYHIIPLEFLQDWIVQYLSKGGPPLFISDIEKKETRLRKGLRTNNQLFWDIFSDYIGKTQVKARFQIRFKSKFYEITDVPINSIIDGGIVFLHEGGTPKIISEALKSVFEDDYMDIEFPEGTYQKTLDESKFIKRAVKVNKIFPKAKSNYRNTDYDYILDLNPLGIKVKIGFDLTCGLWHKGGLPSAEKVGYVNQWRYNIFEVPKYSKEFICIWHYGLQTKIELYKSYEIGEYLSSFYPDSSLLINKKTNLKEKILKNYRSIVIPFYRDENQYSDLTKELKNFEPIQGEFEKTSLFNILKNLLIELK